jgi:type III pantothenate kinase
MTLLLDIGNTHTHLGWADASGVRRTRDVDTAEVLQGQLARSLKVWIGTRIPDHVALCSVVPAAIQPTRTALRKAIGREAVVLAPDTLPRDLLTLRYPRPETIGTDRIANAIAVRHLFGCPAIAIDFGTATTFDVVDARGRFIGGVIAPGISALADYLHEKTAQLPRIRLQEPRSAIGRSTVEAMQVGTMVGYRGLIREVLQGIRRQLGDDGVRIVATGSYARPVTRHLPEIERVQPHLTLEGLRLFSEAVDVGCRAPRRNPRGIR